MQVACRVPVTTEELVLIIDATYEGATHCFRRTRRIDCGEMTVRVEKAMTGPGAVTVGSDDLTPVVDAGRVCKARLAGIGVVDGGENAVCVEKAVFVPEGADAIRPHDLPKVVQAAGSGVADCAGHINEGKDVALFESSMSRAGQSEAVANLPKNLPLIVYTEGDAEGKAGSGAEGLLPVMAAYVPASRIRRSNAFGTGSVFSRRIERVVLMISKRSNSVVMWGNLQCDPGSQPATTDNVRALCV